MTYGVITKIEADGNTCDDLAIPDSEGVLRLIETGNEVGQPTHIRMPVFHIGEILFLNDSGREVIGRGRKPCKWAVTCEEFETVEEAIKKAMEVTER